MTDSRTEYVLKMIQTIESNLNTNEITLRIDQHKSPIVVGVYAGSNKMSNVNILNFTMFDLVQYGTSTMSNIIKDAYNNHKKIEGAKK